MTWYYFQVSLTRVLDCGDIESLTFATKQKAYFYDQAESVVRAQSEQEFPDWRLFVWGLDFLSWSAIRDREEKFGLKLASMKAEGVYA